MHISEGILKPEILVTGAAVSLVILSFCLKKISNEDVGKVSIFSGIFFLASFIHIPFGPTSIHLVLNGLLGAFLGYRAFVAIFVALFFQGILFGYGGFTTLGVNLLILGLPTFVGAFLIKKEYKNRKIEKIYYFFSGMLPIIFSSFLLSCILYLSQDEFLKAANVVFLSTLPLSFIEGFITLFAIIFIKKVYPDFLKEMSCE